MSSNMHRINYVVNLAQDSNTDNIEPLKFEKKSVSLDSLFCIIRAKTSLGALRIKNVFSDYYKYTNMIFYT